MNAEIIIEQHRTAAVLIGAEPLSPWRPSDERLRSVVDAVERVGTSDVGLVLDELRAADPSWPWPAFVRELLTRWDERLDVVDAYRTLLELGRTVEHAYAALDVRVDALVKARAEAERALANTNRACALFEREARTISAVSPARLAVLGVLSSTPANDLVAERRHA